MILDAFASREAELRRQPICSSCVPPADLVAPDHWSADRPCRPHHRDPSSDGDQQRARVAVTCIAGFSRNCERLGRSCRARTLAPNSQRGSEKSPARKENSSRRRSDSQRHLPVTVDDRQNWQPPQLMDLGSSASKGAGSTSTMLSTKICLRNATSTSGPTARICKPCSKNRSCSKKMDNQ